MNPAITLLTFFDQIAPASALRFGHTWNKTWDAKLEHMRLDRVSKERLLLSGLSVDEVEYVAGPVPLHLLSAVQWWDVLPKLTSGNVLSFTVANRTLTAVSFSAVFELRNEPPPGE